MPAIIAVIVVSWAWQSDGRLIESKLRGEQTRPIPRVYGRPFQIRVGQPLSQTELVQRLNDVGYAERPKPEQPGAFSIAGNAVLLIARPQAGEPPRIVRVDFARGLVTRLSPVGGKGTIDHVTLEAPLLAALAAGEKRRYVPLAAIPKQMIEAVIAIEDHRFFEHPGVDPIRAVGALVTNLRGDKPYLVGGSTLTQQIVKNTFLTPEKTMRRKLQEQFMALVLESRFTKNQILELYLNDVVLGQRGPFEIHGVGEASRLFFGKDVSNVSLAEAATIAGVIQSPSRLSPFRNPDRALERRNVVLREMADDGYATKADAEAAMKLPLGVTARALENEAPYFVDYVSQLVDEKYANLLKKDSAVDVYTTLDLHLQRLAQEAVNSGLADIDKALAARKKKESAEAALVAVDPRTGEILAMVGGRAYNVSQFNRAVAAHRQPGSTFKPFVYLAAFERMAAEGRGDLDAGHRRRRRADDVPGRRQGVHAVELSERVRGAGHAARGARPLAEHRRHQGRGADRLRPGREPVEEDRRRLAGTSRIRRSRSASSKRRRSTWRRRTRSSRTRGPCGRSRPSRSSSRAASRARSASATRRPVAREDTTFLVTNMMRSVMDEGTGAGARAAGFTLRRRRQDRARRTTCATRGSSASRRNSSRSSGSASTTTSRSASAGRRPRCRSGRRS